VGEAGGAEAVDGRFDRAEQCPLNGPSGDAADHADNESERLVKQLHHLDHLRRERRTVRQRTAVGVDDSRRAVA
jgi:hypothetical protein